jgi:hypothetical protein
MGALLRAGQLVLGIAVAAAVISSCYSAGEGTDPPPNTFYFPVGLAVSDDGNVLYVANSDFDLQWNGGTLQTYDLRFPAVPGKASVRAVAMGQISDNLDAGIGGGCMAKPPANGAPLGQACSPPTDSTPFNRRSVVIGALATDALLSVPPAPAPSPPSQVAPKVPQRLFVPVRGEAAVTWADVGLGADPANMGDEFAIVCGQENSGGRCDAIHSVGSDPNQLGNTRNATMPGEPFGIALSQDDTVLTVTSQTDTKTSLLTTGLPALKTTDVGATDAGATDAGATDAGATEGGATDAGATEGGATDAGATEGGATPMPAFPSPVLQFVLDGLPVGGVGIAAVPHDPGATVPPCEQEKVVDTPPCVRPAFLETNRNTAELDLLRYYDDDGSTLHRPFLVREAVYPITSNAVGTDSRGIAIDSTPRIACTAQGNPAATCAQLPARVFFASRTPAALGIGQIGGFPPSGVGPYDPDLLVLLPPVSLPPGPSKVYLAPIVDQTGALALRVFVVLFDSSQIVVYDPDAQAIEKIIPVGAGPFAMAFDPFTFDDVGRHQSIKTPRASGPMAGTTPFAYRFAYVASFTQSYVQLIDLDNSQPTAETFENVVFTLGKPTLPKGQ